MIEKNVYFFIFFFLGFEIEHKNVFFFFTEALKIFIRFEWFMGDKNPGEKVFNSTRLADRRFIEGH